MHAGNRSAASEINSFLIISIDDVLLLYQNLFATHDVDSLGKALYRTVHTYTLKGVDSIILGGILFYHVNDIHNAVGILHTILLIYAYPVEACLVGVGDVGISRPSIVTYALIEDEVEVLVEGPLALVEMRLIGRLVVSSHLLAIEVPDERCGIPRESEGVVGS